MTSALIVGSRGSGLTTFAGLLYTAQVRFANEERGLFRFHADRESLRQLDALYADLGAGQFPRLDLNWEDHPLSFDLSFRTRRFRLWAGPGTRAGGVGGARVRVAGITTEELAELGEHDYALGNSTNRMLHSQVLILLIDASRLRAGPRPSVLPGEDAPLAATLELVARYLSTEPDRRARTLHPLFILTKLDQCPAATWAGEGAPPGPPPTWPAGERQRVGLQLLERYLPVTRHWLTGSRSGAPVPVAPAEWYYSSLQLEGGDVPQIVRRSRLPAGGWEPEYPYAEYRALIERLGDLAQRLPDFAEG